MWVISIRALLPPKLLPYSKAEALLPHEEGEMGYRTYPPSQENLWKHSEEVHYLFNPVALLIPSLTLPSLLEEGMQTEIRLGYNPVLQCLQNLNHSSSVGDWAEQRGSKLECKYNAWQIKMERRHEQEWARMDWEGAFTYQEIFSMFSLADSVKLCPAAFLPVTPLPYGWCISSDWVADQNHSSYCGCDWAGGADCSRALKQPNSLTWNSSSDHTSCARSTFWGQPFHWVLIIWVPCQPLPAKWGCSPSSSFGDFHEQRTWINSPEGEVMSEHSSIWGWWLHTQRNTRNQNWFWVTKTGILQPSLVPLEL